MWAKKFAKCLSLKQVKCLSTWARNQARRNWSALMDKTYFGAPLGHGLSVDKCFRLLYHSIHFSMPTNKRSIRLQTTKHRFFLQRLKSPSHLSLFAWPAASGKPQIPQINSLQKIFALNSNFLLDEIQTVCALSSDPTVDWFSEILLFISLFFSFFPFLIRFYFLADKLILRVRIFLLWVFFPIATSISNQTNPGLVKQIPSRHSSAITKTRSG